METDHFSLGAITLCPRLTRVTGDVTLPIPRAHEHDLRVRRVDGNLTEERLSEIPDGLKRLAAIAADPKPPAGRGIDDVRISWVERRSTAGVTAQLGLVDHPPVVSPIFGQVCGAHVTVDHHQVRIGR